MKSKVPKAADLQAEIEHYKEREAYFARVLSVTDGGQYRVPCRLGQRDPARGQGPRRRAEGRRGVAK